MNYNGSECPVCKEKFNQNDDIVVCPVCGTPHHRECWKNNNGCYNNDKHSEGFVWQLDKNITEQNVSDFSTASDDLKICPRCGEKNALYEPVCTRCGERLKTNANTIHDKMNNGGNFGRFNENFNPNNFSPYQNVYAADARTVFGPDAKIEDIPVTEVAEYVQKDSTKYINKFMNMQEKKTKLSWNWSAGIFSALWCFYRKMTGCGLALFALFFSCYLLSSFVPAAVYEKYQPETYEAYSSSLSSLYDEMQESMTTGTVTEEYYEYFSDVLLSPVMITTYIMLISMFLIISVIFGFFGNYFYKKKILKDIRQIRQVSGDSMTYHMYIKHRGGASAANVIIPVFLYMLMNMFMNVFNS